MVEILIRVCNRYFLKNIDYGTCVLSRPWRQRETFVLFIPHIIFDVGNFWELQRWQKDIFIVAINGHLITTWGKMTDITKESNGKSLAITVRRGGSILTFNIIPELVTVKNTFGEKHKRYLMGIMASGEVLNKKPGQSE